MNTLDLLGFDPELLNLTQAIEAETFELSVVDTEYLERQEFDDEEDEFTDEDFDACMGLECSNDWEDR